MPTAAWGDGDPASDVLLATNAYYPYAPPTSTRLQRTLGAELNAARRAKFPIEVALIASPTDLGVIPSLYNKPEDYASFLDQELSFGRRLPLLVVMPSGYGVAGVGPAVHAVASGLPRPTAATYNVSDDLALAAIAAVPKLAIADRHAIGPVSGLSEGRPTTSDGRTVVMALAAGVAFLLSSGAALFILRRRRRVSEPR